MKKLGDMIICVDLGKVNQCVHQETFTLPTLDDIFYELSGSITHHRMPVVGIGRCHLMRNEKCKLLTTW